MTFNRAEYCSLGLCFVAMVMLSQSAFAQATVTPHRGGYEHITRPPKPPEPVPTATTPLSPRDQLAAAIVWHKVPQVSAFIRSGMTLDFDYVGQLPGRPPWSPLTMAVGIGYLDIVRMLLEAGADVRRQDGTGKSAIHYVRSIEAARLLIKFGADLNAHDANGRTAAVNAIENGNLEMLDVLLANGARIDAPIPLPDLITRVIQARKPELIVPLLERGVNPRSPPTQALSLLIESGDVKHAKLLIRHGADVNAHDGLQALVGRALIMKQWEFADALLDAETSVKMPDSSRCVLSTEACDSIQLTLNATFNPRMLAKLKARGLDLDAVSSRGYLAGHTALTAIIVEQPMAIRVVSGGGSIGVAFNPVTGKTTYNIQNSAPPHEIPAPDNAARSKALLELGIDPNKKYHGLTPLTLAISMANKPKEMTDALIKAGARIEFDATLPRSWSAKDPPASAVVERDTDPNLPSVPLSALANNYQNILTGMRVGPLSWAALLGRPEIALQLVKRDRKVEPSDRNLLYFSASSGYWDLVVGALPYTREVNAANRADVTPLMLAADAGRVDVVRALLAAGAAVNKRSASRWPPLTETNFIDEFLGGFGGHSAGTPKLVGGITALGAARAQGHFEVVRILANAGGKE